MKHWYCAECETEVALGKHGQCECCGSEAVDLLPAEATVNASDSKGEEIPGTAPACA